ncbi:hypothetical protein GH714_023146 [Hevea brasiliensis]|uniref:Uncharacterized protein n=1 Tax=Hevea brasiliensis TaxID=3981 RepID=A0A6A6N6A8_HEVBR|nr:hypothetical protein GH714_023146 [Hevea brasiliensis]
MALQLDENMFAILADEVMALQVDENMFAIPADEDMALQVDENMFAILSDEDGEDLSKLVDKYRDRILEEKKEETLLVKRISKKKKRAKKDGRQKLDKKKKKRGMIYMMGMLIFCFFFQLYDQKLLMALQQDQNTFAILADEEGEDLSKLVDKYPANSTASPPQEKKNKQKQQQPKEKQEQADDLISAEIFKAKPFVLPDHGGDKEQQEELKNGHNKRQGSDEWVR